MCCTASFYVNRQIPKLGEQTKNTIKFVSEKLGIDLKYFESDMIEAESCDKLVFTYFGPEKFRYTFITEEPYNCLLELFGRSVQFLSTTNYDSRQVRKNIN